MSGQKDDRSIIIGGGVSGTSIVTGDNNRVTTTLTLVKPPPGHEVDISAGIAALRTLMDRLVVPEHGKLGRALDDASEEAAKATPDKQEVATALERAIRVSKGAADFAKNAAEIQDRVVYIAGWLGPLANAALGLLGLTS